MGEYCKTAVLWGVVTAVMLVTCWIVFVTAPPMFSSFVTSDDAPATAQEYVTEYLERFGKVDLNGATASELSALPYVTDELALSIRMERDRRPHGFSTLEELLCVDGVTEEMLALWENLLYCG